MIRIPCICPIVMSLVTGQELYVTSQPIMQLKELEVDRVRYDQWRKSLEREGVQPGRKKRKR